MRREQIGIDYNERTKVAIVTLPGGVKMQFDGEDADVVIAKVTEALKEVFGDKVSNISVRGSLRRQS